MRDSEGKSAGEFSREKASRSNNREKPNKPKEGKKKLTGKCRWGGYVPPRGERRNRVENSKGTVHTR